MTAPLKFVDAAFAGAITGGPYDGFVFYIGGDAFHIWPLADVHARPERYRLPAWVRSDPQNVNPITDADACMRELEAYSVPAGSLVALDSETSVDPGWVAQFAGVLNGAGYPVIDYGSQSTVFGNRNPDGYYWGADWTSVPHLAAGDDMTQYISYRNDDVSLADPNLPFWDMRPAPQPIAQWTEFDMSKLPVLKQGAADVPGGGFWYVIRAQTLMKLTGGINGLRDAAAITADGIYGPATDKAARTVQQFYGITVDGITGPETWSVLLTGAPG